MAIILLTLYELFTSLSDIGLLGFYTCSVPVPAFMIIRLRSGQISLLDQPFIQAPSLHQDVTVVAVHLGPDGTGSTYNALYHSNWADASLFAGPNMTDSDTLMPCQLGRYNSQNSFP